MKLFTQHLPHTGHWLAALLTLAAPAALAQTFDVTSSTPAAHAPSASRTAPFELQFSRPVDPTTWDGITVFASSKHAINTKGTGANNGRVIVTPAVPLRAGETVSLTVPASVYCCRSSGGGGLPNVKRVVAFTAAASGTPTARLFTRFQPDQRMAHLSDATLQRLAVEAVDRDASFHRTAHAHRVEFVDFRLDSQRG